MCLYCKCLDHRKHVTTTLHEKVNNYNFVDQIASIMIKV